MAQQQMRGCPNCGLLAVPGQRFCANCGTAVDTEENKQTELTPDVVSTSPSLDTEENKQAELTPSGEGNVPSAEIETYRSSPPPPPPAYSNASVGYVPPVQSYPSSVPMYPDPTGVYPSPIQSYPSSVPAYPDVSAGFSQSVQSYQPPMQNSQAAQRSSPDYAMPQKDSTGGVLGQIGCAMLSIILVSLAVCGGGGYLLYLWLYHP